MLCVPPAEPVCGSCAGSHVMLTLEKWPHINHTPPGALGGSSQSAGSKADSDPKATPDVPIWSRITTNPDCPESACDIPCGSHPWSARPAHPLHMSQVGGVPQHQWRNLPDASSRGSLPLGKGHQMAGGAISCHQVQIVRQCRSGGTPGQNAAGPVGSQTFTFP